MIYCSKKSGKKLMSCMFALKLGVCKNLSRGKDNRRVATAREYNHIRWHKKKTIKTLLASFRVQEDFGCLIEFEAINEEVLPLFIEQAEDSQNEDEVIYKVKSFTTDDIIYNVSVVYTVVTKLAL
ncbi:hypothetical protein BDF21DRAFT_397244 [Thamnidium elegans]|nr:hypothetical protein BDF21DRAFT_397244 [Thamnidium elegans]